MKCEHLVPFPDMDLREDQGTECLLKEGHEGDHLVLSAKGIFVGWQYERCPDCIHPDCNDLMECYVQGTMPLVEATRLLCWGVDCSALSWKTEKYYIVGDTVTLYGEQFTCIVGHESNIFGNDYFDNKCWRRDGKIQRA